MIDVVLTPLLTVVVLGVALAAAQAIRSNKK